MPKVINILLFLLFSFSAGAVSFNWSGWNRFETYYQQSDEPSYYGNYHFVLRSQIHLKDGLDFNSRIDLWPYTEAFNSFSLSSYRQTGFVFLYKEFSQALAYQAFPLFLFSLSQLYIDYQSEFFKIRFGQAPYHFGLGTTYSAEENPFQHWISVYKQLAVHIEYSSLYLQPAFLYTMSFSEQNTVTASKQEKVAEQGPSSSQPVRESRALLGVLQAGLLREDFKVSLLGQYNFREEQYFAEAYGEYRKTNWELRASSSYAFTDQTSFALALEGTMDFPTKIPLRLEVKAGAITGDLAFHPNYDLALLFWNRMIKDSGDRLQKSYPYQINEGQVQKGLYFSPRLIFSFFNDQLKVKPLFLLAKSLEDEKINYELDLEGHYKFNDYMFFSLIGGALYKQKINFALLGQAAVSF